LPIFLVAFEFRTWKLRTFSTNFEILPLDTTGYKRTGWVLIEKIRAGTPGTS
jgi:hypothetical protein